MMECYPAIDIRGGACVRLLRGDFAAETSFGDPLEVAEGYVAAGARWLHVVDLDAARSGTADRANRDLVLRIAGSAGVPVQAGGGVRDDTSASTLLDGGVERVVLSTAAVEDPGLVTRLAESYPGRVAVGLDHRASPGGGREVAVRGWAEGSGRDLHEVLVSLREAPLGAVVVTDISRDGTLAGPDLDGLRDVLAVTDLPVIASGGVGGAADLRALASLHHEGRSLAGAIVGRAILSGALTVEEAVAACGS